ncbi:hypothetical protein PoHVEF18_009724 [Penicillium ochrochloron]
MPDWYSSLPSDAKYAFSSVKAVVSSDIIAWDSSLLAQATEVTTTSAAAGASGTSSSTSVITGVTVSGSQTATSKIAGTSTSTGGATGATGGLVMGVAGAAGILGLALALKRIGTGGQLRSIGVSYLIECGYVRVYLRVTAKKQSFRQVALRI